MRNKGKDRELFGNFVGDGVCICQGFFDKRTSPMLAMSRGTSFTAEGGLLHQIGVVLGVILFKAGNNEIGGIGALGVVGAVEQHDIHVGLNGQNGILVGALLGILVELTAQLLQQALGGSIGIQLGGGDLGIGVAVAEIGSVLVDPAHVKVTVGAGQIVGGGSGAAAILLELVGRVGIFGLGVHIVLTVAGLDVHVFGGYVGDAVVILVQLGGSLLEVDVAACINTVGQVDQAFIGDGIQRALDLVDGGNVGSLAGDFVIAATAREHGAHRQTQQKCHEKGNELFHFFFPPEK